MRGYQFGSPDAFECNDFRSCPTNINIPYVDGVSISHGVSLRKHIWTYAGGYHCPCAGHGASPPAFVGSDYYCELRVNIGSWQSVLYPDDPLWDGEGCDGLEGTCCDPPNLPWFCKELPQSSTDYFEFRICGDADRNNEDTPIDFVQLYIQ